MTKKLPMIRIFEDDLMFDPAMGRTFVSCPEVSAAARRIFSPLSVGDQSVTDSLLQETQALISEHQNKGYLLGNALAEQAIPSNEAIEGVRCKKLIFEITEKCNLRCTYCVYSGAFESEQHRKHSLKHLEIETALKALEKLAPYLTKDTIVAFYGGEPCLCEQAIRRIVQAFRELRPDWKGVFSLTTNMTAISESFIRFLVDENFAVIVSLDGPEEIHDRCRKTTGNLGTHKLVMENLQKFESVHPSFLETNAMSNTVITRESDIPIIERYFATQAPRFLSSRFSMVINPNKQAAAKPAIGEFALSALEKCMSVKEILGSPLLRHCTTHFLNSFGSPATPDKKGARKYRACIPGENIFVKSNGMLSICEKCESLVIGSVKDGIDFGVTKSAIEKIASVFSNRCLDCWAQSFCEICFMHCWTGTCVSEQELDLHCSSYRKWAERAFPAVIRLIRRMPEIMKLRDELYKQPKALE